MPRSISAEVGLNLNEKTILAGLVADNAALRAAMTVLLAKLDADAGVTDTTYVSLCTPTPATIGA
jgi:energy-converting hydrogenase Eha subunit G